MARRRTPPRRGPAPCAALQGPGAETGVDGIQGGVQAAGPGAVEGAVWPAGKEILLHRPPWPTAGWERCPLTQ